jgi:hypothetical protein
VDGRPLVTAAIVGDDLVVTCHRWGVLGALRRRVAVPLAQVAGARVVSRQEATDRIGWKLAGSFLTRRRFIGGTFTVRGAKGTRQWWAAPAGDPVLVVDLRDHRWSRIVVRTPDQDALATQLHTLRGA